MEFDLENPLPLCSETLASLFLVEPDHMPGEQYVRGLRDGGFDVAVRRDIVSSISRLSSRLDPLSSYLAVNYLDRFLSCQSLPHLSPWVLRLLAVCCVSLAAKMRNTDFSLADFQGDGGFVHDSRTIQRMEVLILGALKWRMRSVTPFSFVAFFTSLFKLKDPPLRQALNARATEIIFKSQNGTCRNLSIRRSTENARRKRVTNWASPVPQTSSSWTSGHRSLRHRLFSLPLTSSSPCSFLASEQPF
ncbi:hypothetical protein EUGRSUZ_A01768 [Eucalyptus grandis]|uniref:Uncharacterized protein n=2 Tax=Eucalyptus grandis TaxID=71139 RepID=A0ACC3M5B7_EUCGR|nr:hypothetical protein EUGRSUZ_A01768 [Eucalyptus grandis]